MTMCDTILVRLKFQHIILDLVCIPSGPQPAQPRHLFFGFGGGQMGNPTFANLPFLPGEVSPSSNFFPLLEVPA